MPWCLQRCSSLTNDQCSICKKFRDQFLSKCNSIFLTLLRWTPVWGVLPTGLWSEKQLIIGIIARDPQTFTLVNQKQKRQLNRFGPGCHGNRKQSPLWTKWGEANCGQSEFKDSSPIDRHLPPFKEAVCACVNLWISVRWVSIQWEGTYKCK